MSCNICSLVINPNFIFNIGNNQYRTDTSHIVSFISIFEHKCKHTDLFKMIHFKVL